MWEDISVASARTILCSFFIPEGDDDVYIATTVKGAPNNSNLERTSLSIVRG